MAKKPETPVMKASISKVMLEIVKDVELRRVALSKAVDRLCQHLDAHKPDTGARAATNLLAIEPQWDDIKKVQELLGGWINRYRVSVVPEAFLAEGIKTTTLDTQFGSYRFSIQSRWSASIQEGKKEAAYAWLKTNKHGDIIQETVNSSTLAAFAKNMATEEGVDLPEDLFKVAQIPVTSVTKTK
jgi:hypothetical protein